MWRDLTSGETAWEYRPAWHKTAGRATERVVIVRPKAQEILNDMLKADSQSSLFDPRDVAEAHHRDRSGRQRHVVDVDLLDHARLIPGRESRPAAALGAEINPTIERRGVARLGREGMPSVLIVAGLAADLALPLNIRRQRLGRFDDVGRRGSEDVAEFFRVAASCSGSLATIASIAATRVSNRRQFGQDFRALGCMARYSHSVDAISP